MSYPLIRPLIDYIFEIVIQKVLKTAKDFMKSVVYYLCLPFSICCPCLRDTKSTRTKQTAKTGHTERSDRTNMDRKERSPKQKRRYLTEEGPLTTHFLIPDHYKSINDCFESQGLDQKEILGQGGYATVFKVEDLRTGEVMACKMLKLNNDSSYESSLSELSIMIRAKRNDNIIQVKKHFILKDVDKKVEFFYIFMELADGGSIVDRMAFNDQTTGLITYRPLVESTAKDYFSQTVNGLQFLHSLGIAHKDLKLKNILVFLRNDAKHVIKITDFGLSGIRYDVKRKIVIKDSIFVGTLEYMSPQILRLHIYYHFRQKVAKLKQFDAFKADSWALGVCLYVMITATLPFKPGDESLEDLTQMYGQMTHNKYEITENMKKCFSQNCLQLIGDLLESNPSKRLPINTVVFHKWLKQ